MFSCNSLDLLAAIIKRMFHRELPEKVTLKLPFSHQNSPKSNLFRPQNR